MSASTRRTARKSATPGRVERPRRVARLSGRRVHPRRPPRRGLGVELVRFTVEEGPYAERRWILHTRGRARPVREVRLHRERPHPRARGALAGLRAAPVGREQLADLLPRAADRDPLLCEGVPVPNRDRVVRERLLVDRETDSAILPQNVRSRRVSERGRARFDGQMEVVGLTWDRYVWPLATGGAAQREPALNEIGVLTPEEATMATTLATWTIDPVHSSVEFSLDYMGFSTYRTGFRALERSSSSMRPGPARRRSTRRSRWPAST